MSQSNAGPRPGKPASLSQGCGVVRGIPSTGGPARRLGGSRCWAPLDGVSLVSTARWGGVSLHLQGIGYRERLSWLGMKAGPQPTPRCLPTLNRVTVVL